MTLADGLAALWAIVGATRLWPGLLGRLGWPWPAIAAAALTIPLAAAWRGPFGLSVGTVLAPLAAGVAAVVRLPAGERERCLEAAVLSGLALVLGRALAQSATSVPVAALAGASTLVVAPRLDTAAAAALLGLSQVPVLLHGLAAASQAGAADDLIAGVTATVALWALARAARQTLRVRKAEGRSRM